MTISEWLDEKEAEGVDVSHIALPADLSFDEAPEETIFFEEIKLRFSLSAESPIFYCRRFGHWYLSRGQDKKAGIHAEGMEWKLITKDKDLAIKTAKFHIE